MEKEKNETAGLKDSMPSQAGHWYTQGGEPAYYYENNKGKVLPTTLREARKLGLVPSVTTIIACQARPGLDIWKQEQTILACLTLQRMENEPENKYIERIKQDAKEQSEKAAKRGTQIHAWVQMGFEYKEIPIEGIKFFTSAKAEIHRCCGEQDWACEKAFSSDLGFGGKVDLQNSKFVIDIKTTEKDIETLKLWDDHLQQLAAYSQNDGRQCGILYINSITGVSKLIWAEQIRIERGWKSFLALLEFWKVKNNYRPEEVVYGRKKVQQEGSGDIESAEDSNS